MIEAGTTTYSPARAGAREGMIVWATYGVIEAVFSLMAPSLLHLRVVVPVSVAFTGIAFAVYLVAGATLGAAAGAVFSRAFAATQLRSTDAVEDVWSLSLLASVVGAFTINAAFENQLKAALPGAAMAAAVLVYSWLRSVRERRCNRRVGSHLWIVISLLVGMPYLLEERPGTDGWTQNILLGCYVLGVFGAAAIFRRFRLASRRLGRVDLIPKHRGLVQFLLVLGVLVSAWAMSEERLNRTASASALETLAATDKGRPNVILITFDSVRADHMSVYGYGRDTTPHLRTFAREATLFTACFAASNQTLSSYGSILTGLLPSRHGAWPLPGGIATGLTKQAATLAELLRGYGYWTIGIAANTARLRGSFGFSRGFAVYDDSMPTSFLGKTKPYFIRQGLQRIASVITQRRQDTYRVSRDAGSINAEVEAYLREAARSHRPLFLFLNYMDAHWPYLPPAPFDDRYPGRIAGFDWLENPTFPLTAQQSEHLISQYDGSIAYLDQATHELLDILRELDLFENSLVVVSADHGEGFGEHGLIGHARALYQSEVHVPLIVKFPSTQSAAVVGHAVSGVDLFPGILNSVGLKIPDDLDGRSFTEPSSASRDWVISEALDESGGGIIRALISGSMKLIQGPHGERELYDLASDAHEERRISDFRRMRQGWEAQMRHLDGRLIKVGPRGPDPEALERLRALGYVR